MLNLLRARPASVELPTLLVANPDLKPSIPPAPSQYLEPSVTEHGALMVEYARVAGAVGFRHPHIEADFKIENFKAFLRRKGWTIFALPTVVAYMDKKAEAESVAQSDWLWRPLRECDHLPDMMFGKRGYEQRSRMGIGTINAIAKQAASDYYHGSHHGFDNRYDQHREMEPSAPAYDKLVPLHALRKVAETEAEFDGEDYVSFFVADYAPAPQIEYVDPFLMAVVNNTRLDKGVGRFVIDFWDEPGFGVKEQLGIAAI